MSRFANSRFNLKSLADNSYKAIEEGAYDAEKYDFTRHDSISMKSAILSCSHAPIITEIKFASPSKGQIIAQREIDFIQLAFNMISSGSIGLSVLTQPYLFNGSIDYLAKIRKKIIVPILMKDIIVSEIQIDSAKRIGADCVLFIKAIFDQDLAESSLEKLAKYDKGKNIIISESGITNADEIRYLKKVGADAFLIGTSIMESNDIASKVKQLYLSV